MKRTCIAWLMVLAVLVTVIGPAVALAAEAPDTETSATPPDEAQRITLSDVVLAARALTGQTELTAEQLEKLDLNEDGDITLSEVVTLAKRYVAQQNEPQEPSPSPAPSASASPTTEPSASPSASQEPSAAVTPDATAAPTSTAFPTADPSGRVLVVYYSATGTTRRVAEMIAEEVGADLTLSLEPVDPYTREDLNYSDPASRVSREHNDPALRTVPLVVDTVEDWEMYDTVFVGYPIWWGIAAWPVNGFLTANDFTGKTVIPFCTSGSSGIGQSAQLLAQEAGGGTWIPGQRFSSSVSQETIREWISGLNLEG